MIVVTFRGRRRESGIVNCAGCDRGDISWLAQCFVRIRRVDPDSCRGRRVGIVRLLELWLEVNVAVTLGLACERYDCLEEAAIPRTAWQGCVMCVLRWVFPRDFWRTSRTKRSFCRLGHVSF